MAQLLFVGCGKMGGALLRGFGEKAERTVVVKPTPLQADLAALKGVLWTADIRSVADSFCPDAVILAIKPQQMAAALPLYSAYRSSVFLSLAAGQTLARLAALLKNPGQACVRAMPNLPASLGKGISVAVANAFVSPAQRALCQDILSAGGDVAWADREALLDPVTALSGSGPAYVFALVEAMAAAGVKLGLPPELAEKCARQTVIGSGALLAQTDQSAAALRQAVTSPGGTTAAALAHLQAEQGLDSLLCRAMEAAARRAKELST